MTKPNQKLIEEFEDKFFTMKAINITKNIDCDNEEKLLSVKEKLKDNFTQFPNKHQIDGVDLYVESTINRESDLQIGREDIGEKRKDSFLLPAFEWKESIWQNAKEYILENLVENSTDNPIIKITINNAEIIATFINNEHRKLPGNILSGDDVVLELNAERKYGNSKVSYTAESLFEYKEKDTLGVIDEKSFNYVKGDYYQYAQIYFKKKVGNVYGYRIATFTKVCIGKIWNIDLGNVSEETYFLS